MFYVGFVTFLSNRIKRVKVGLSFSSSSPVCSGVAQGNVLDPILFLIFINDICGEVRNDAKMKLFADDVKLYRKII